MNVNLQRDISFKSIYTNGALKKGLEFAADNGALFAASTILTISMFARPAAIWLAPHTDKENKKFACAKSIASSIAGYLITLGISTPIAKSIKKIDKNPEKYLKPTTIEHLKDAGKGLYESKAYAFSTQIFKLGAGILTAIPKALLTAAWLPIVMHHLFKKKPTENKKSNNLTFKGKNDRLANQIGKIIDKEGMKTFSTKYKDSNFPMHIVAATDALTTATFIHQTNNSKQIDENRKKALIYNAGISTGLSIISSYIIDRALKKPTEKFIKAFEKANKGDVNLKKQVEGIKIAKPIIIVGIVYYMFIPFVSTYLAEKADKNPKLDLHKKNHK